MKTVMVSAYTKFNLGDDLFIKVLCERYPKTNFVLYAPREYKILFKEMDNLIIFPSDPILIRGINFAFKIFKIRNFFRRRLVQMCDIGVYIGGSLFMQGKNWRKGLENVKEMRKKNKPFFLLGANFGPFIENEFFQEYKEIFKEYTDICFREKNSYALFNDLSNVRMADDIIFQLSSKKLELVHLTKNIVISVIKPSIRKDLALYDDIYYKKIKDITVYFIEKGYEVTLMSFCELEGDKDAIEAIINLIPKNYLYNVSKYLYKLNIAEALDIIQKSNFVVATRFHSMILGWVYKKPVFPITYSTKMLNVMNDLSFKGAYAELNSIESLKPEDVFESMKTNVIDVSKQKKNAEKNFEKIDNFLVK